MEKTTSQISYDKIAPYYRQVSDEREVYLKSVDNIIHSYVAGKNSLADLGSGDGVRILEICRKANINNFLLVDNSAEMIKSIKSNSSLPLSAINHSIVDFKPQTKYDIVTCLWNVLGHVETIEEIKETIINVEKNTIKQNGLFILDVNNRYNSETYGVKQVIKNIFLDILFPFGKKYVEFYKDVFGQRIKMSVHFFNPWEIDFLISKTSLRLNKKIYLNYETGRIEKFFWRGQIIYILEKQ